MFGLTIAIVVGGTPGWAKWGASMNFASPEQVIWLPEMFHNIQGIQITPEGMVWVTADNLLSGLNTEGKLVKVGIPIRVPMGLAYNAQSKRLCVSYLIGLKVFDSGGNELADRGINDLRECGVNHAMHGLIPYEKGFLLVGYNEKTGNVLNVFNESGEFQRSFGAPVQDPEQYHFPPTIFIPQGLAASGKWLTCVDPYSYDLLVYENESLKHRIHLPIPESRMLALAPEIKFQVYPNGDNTTTMNITTGVRTAILGDLAMVVVEPVSLVEGGGWLWAVDLNKGEILNSIQENLVELNLSFLGLDEKGNPLFWNRKGVFRVAAK